MNSGEIDRLPVSQLVQRYGGLARSAVYTRMDALGIKPEKVGNKAFVNQVQLRLLDELHRFLQTGRTTAEFLDMKGIPKADNKGSETSSGLSPGQLNPGEWTNIIGFITSEVASRLLPAQPEPNPLAYLEQLEQAAQKRWLLRTTEIASLLGMTVAEIQQYGDRFYEAGFVFTRTGYRAGGEFAWQVSKQ